MSAEFKQLLNQARGCTLCASQLPFNPNPIIQLHPAAKILIVGQAPGLAAHRSSKPFNDPSGNRLRQWLGISNDQFYNPQYFAILPMGFCYPGKGKSGDLPPLPTCAEQWQMPLLSQLPNIQLIILIGRFAQQWHLGNKRKPSLTETVRHWQDFWPMYLPLPHPSPRNNGWIKQNPWFEQQILPTLQQRINEILAFSR